MYINFTLLEELWSTRQRKLPRKARINPKRLKYGFKVKAPPKRELIRFDGEQEQIPQKRKIAAHVFGPGVDFAARLEQMLHPERVTDAETLRWRVRMLPSEAELEYFARRFDEMKMEDAGSLATLERLWFHLKDAPLLRQAYRVHTWRLEVQELMADQRKSIDALHRVHEALYDNDEMKQVAQLILFVGNFLNFGAFNGNVEGFRWDIFGQLAVCASTEEPRYNLLMFLVETVHRRYPALVNWTDSFDGLADLHVDEREIQDRARKLSTTLKALVSVLSKRPGDDEKTQALRDVVDATAQTLSAFEEELAEVEAKCSALSIHFGFLSADFRQARSVLANVKVIWQRTERSIRPILRVYPRVVLAYWRVSAREREQHLFQKESSTRPRLASRSALFNALSGDVEDIIYCYLGVSFRSKLMRMYVSR